MYYRYDNGFKIDSDNGEISVNNSEALDFAINPVFNMTINVSDGLFSTSTGVTINLREEKENSPPSIEDQMFSIEENSINGTSIGIIQASDPDGDDLIFSIESGNTDNAFLIGSTSGQLLIGQNGAIDFEEIQEFNLVIGVSDGQSLETATINILVIDVDDVVLSVSEDSKSKLNIFPNPTKHHFSLVDNTPNTEIKIYSQSGKLVNQYRFQPNNLYLLPEKLKNGIYQVLVIKNNQISSNKMIIN